MARIVELIETEITKGSGVSDNPFRTVIQYWTKEGDLLFELDQSCNHDFDCSMPVHQECNIKNQNL